MHDRNGTLLGVGDKVLIAATVTKLHPGATTRSATVKFDDGDQVVCVTCQSEQLLLVDNGTRAAAEADATDAPAKETPAAAVSGGDAAAAPPADTAQATEEDLAGTTDALATSGTVAVDNGDAPTDAAPPARCDCPALDVPHTHEQGGPVAIAEASDAPDDGTVH